MAIIPQVKLKKINLKKIKEVDHTKEVVQVLRISKSQVIVLKSDAEFTSKTFGLYDINAFESDEKKTSLLNIVQVFDDPASFFKLVSEKVRHP